MIEFYPKKPAPKFLSYICAFLYFITGVTLTIAIINTFRGKMKVSCIFICCFTLLVIVLAILSISFSWASRVTLEDKGDYLEYKSYSTLDKGVLDKYYIFSVKEIKKKRNKIIVMGEVENKGGVGHKNGYNKSSFCDIRYYSPEMIEKFNEWVEK